MLAHARVGPVLPVVDMNGARKFYEGILGLEAFWQNDVVLAYACGRETFLTLYQRDTPTRADHTAVVWLVPDVEATVRELGARGVVFEQYDMPGLQTDELGIAGMDDTRSAWFKDPEGNVLSIAQLPEPMR